MAYIPPHKRHSKEVNPTPSPFQAPHHRNPKQKSTLGDGKILYSKELIWRWFVIPSNNGDLSCSVRLEEFVVEVELKHGELKDRRQFAILVRQDDHPNKEVNENANRIVKSPWVSITEKIQQDLLTSFQAAREEMCKDGPELNLPHFVIRFGKILFHGSPYESVDNANNSSAIENILGPFTKRYYTNVPNSFCESIFGQIIPKTGFDFLEDKEHYYVKVFDKLRPGATISCKCSVTEAAGELHLYKMELDEVRQMVINISCLEKNLDLRLLLSLKRILASPSDDEMQNLNSLVNSAIMDSKVKGGLRWPLGKESVSDRYIVVGVRHTKSRIYKSSFMRLKIRQSELFDFRTSTGGVLQEVGLRIPKLTSQLRDPTVELNPLIDAVRDTLKLVWENFLCWEGSYTQSSLCKSFSL